MFPDGTPDMDSAEEMEAVNWEEITQQFERMERLIKNIHGTNRTQASVAHLA